MTELRQGDIIQGLFYPEIFCSKISLIGKPCDDFTRQIIIDSEENISSNLIATEEKCKRGLLGFTAQINVYHGFFIIISQCCDIAKRSDGYPKSQALVAAPLLEVSGDIKKDEDKLIKLKANNSLSYTDSFFILQNQPLRQEYIVNFSQIISFPKKEYHFLLKNKILQMSDEARVSFKKKLSFYFGRPTQEEEDSKLF